MEDIISFYLDSLVKSFVNINRNEILKFVETIKNARHSGNTVFIIGNGGSASTASHFATDLGVGTLKVSKPVKAICLSDNASILTAVSNDINYNSIFTQQLSILANPNDLLVIISASGNSSNLVSAVEVSHSLGMKRFSMTGFDGGKIRELTFENNLHVPSQIGQYGLVEDIHMAICHIITECIRKS